MRRTFEYRLYPTPGQTQRMSVQLASCQRLYNVMLEQRRIAWRSYGRSVSRFDQQSEIKHVRTMPEYAVVYGHVLQNVAHRLDLAFKAFFRRCKAGESPGYPRFRSQDRYDSLTYPEASNGCVRLDVDRQRVSFSKLASEVKVRLHRPIRGVVKSVTVKRKAGRWFVQFSCENVPPDPTLMVGVGEVGVDVGLTSFATLSTGEVIPNPRFGKRALSRLARAQRILSRRVKGSNRRRKQRMIVARLHEHVSRQRRDFAFKVARMLVQRYGIIVVEDLQVRNMVRNRRLARSIMDAAWGIFMHALDCKAEEAGGRVVRVNPRGTSQECSNCGVVVLKGLSERVHRCSSCGLVLGRDHNAAINVEVRAGTRPSRRLHSNAAVETRSPRL